MLKSANPDKEIVNSVYTQSHRSVYWMSGFTVVVLFTIFTVTTNKSTQ
jgi:hypothetical protein